MDWNPAGEDLSSSARSWFAGMSRNHHPEKTRLNPVFSKRNTSNAVVAMLKKMTA
jgi:hypothetical protein